MLTKSMQVIWSQSPQAGQFNSYFVGDLIEEGLQSIYRLNPLKRVNSILTTELRKTQVKSQLALVSIPSSGSIQFLRGA